MRRVNAIGMPNGFAFQLQATELQQSLILAQKKKPFPRPSQKRFQADQFSSIQALFVGYLIADFPDFLPTQGRWRIAVSLQHIQEMKIAFVEQIVQGSHTGSPWSFAQFWIDICALFSTTTSIFWSPRQRRSSAQKRSRRGTASSAGQSPGIKRSISPPRSASSNRDPNRRGTTPKCRMPASRIMFLCWSVKRIEVVHAASSLDGAKRNRGLNIARPKRSHLTASPMSSRAFYK